MSFKPWFERWFVRALIAGTVLGLVGFACVSEDHARTTCSDLADGGVPIYDPPDGTVYDATPTTDAWAPAKIGIEADPGPRCTNCQQTDGLELMPIADYEQAFAPSWFNYGEPGAKIFPQQVGAPPDVPAPYWGLQVVDLRLLPGGARCGSNYALHLLGGRFTSWGGGFGTLYATVRGPENVERYCPADLEASPPTTGGALAPERNGDTCGFWMTPVEATQPARLGLDASMFDGIAFWARRGPGGQAPIRIAVQDTNTSDGFALILERDAYFVANGAASAFGGKPPACQRAVECCIHCNEVPRDVLLYGVDAEGGPVPDGIGYTVEKRCWKHGERPPPDLEEGGEHGFVFLDWATGSWTDVGADGQAYEDEFDDYEREIKLCCPRTMEQDPANGDPQFGGKECNDYTFHYDQSSGRYCWNTDDPPLPEKDQNRCQDGFETSVVVDTEWRLFTIPWSELRRSTLNRPPVDTQHIWAIFLYFGAGWLDTYVDDVGFYRKRP
jgi:hypothetical protein